MPDRPETMAGLSRAEVDRLESKDFAIGSGPLRPRDAATLILVDRSGPEPRILMGRRHRAHAFMPGKFVFPGGRTDPADGRVKVATALDPAVEAKMMHGHVSHTRARAIAMSAIRETYEEAGLLIGRPAPFSTSRPDWQGFAEHGVEPGLDRLRYFARAVTPPGRVRRFDTRFLIAFREDVAVALEGGGPTGELEELVWLPVSDAMELDVPTITLTLLGVLRQRLDADPALDPAGPVPYFRMRHNRMLSELI
jgi:8-oxo-dGTP pyrophosphatase MutT (NUDIX family)